MAAGIRTVRTKSGARLEQDDVVLSQVLVRPGPTHGVFDVLAACLALAPGPRVLMLGFAAGGVVAPLRAMGYRGPLEAVDVSLEGQGLFRELSGAWAGKVRVRRDDAGGWLRRRRRRFDLILDDLSVPGPEGVVKPDLSLDGLPELICRCLSRGGLAVVNLLSRREMSWPALIGRAARPYRRALVVLIEEYENRVVVAGDRLGGAREVWLRLRRLLGKIGSRQATEISVRTVRS